MPAAINVRYLTRYTCCNMSAKVQKNFCYLTYKKMSATINKCQVSYLEMSDTYSIADIYMKLSGTEMSYSLPIAGSYGWNNTGSLVAL